MNSNPLRLKMGMSITLAATFGCMISGATPLFAQTTVASVIAVSGAGTVQRAGGTLPLRPGLPIMQHDRLQTGSRGRVTIAFADHGQAMLGESSVAVIETNPNAGAAIPEITLVSGIVRTIASGADPKSRFEVSTPNALVIARAGKTDTSFYGSRRRGFQSCDRFTDVAVLDGAAEVKNGATGSSDRTTVPSGYVSTVACTSSPTGAGPLGVASARTLNEASAGSGGFLYTFFHDSSPSVEQEDIDGGHGVFDRDDIPPASFSKQVQLLHGPSAIRLHPHISHGPIRIAR